MLARGLLCESGFERDTKRARKREFLDEMGLWCRVPRADLIDRPIAPVPGAKGGRTPFSIETLLRIHSIQ